MLHTYILLQLNQIMEIYPMTSKPRKKTKQVSIEYIVSKNK